MNYKPGDVVLIAFPFTDWTSLKQRPALVVSPAVFNSAHPDIILCAVTSQIPKLVNQFEYLLNQKELVSSGLPKPSLIRLTKIVTLDQRLIRKQLGSLSLASTKRVLKEFREIFKPER